MNHVRQRQPLGGPTHAERELSRGSARVLALSVLAQVLFQFLLAADSHGRQVVEHDRQFRVHQRQHLFGDRLLDQLHVFHQRVHGPRQLLMARFPGHLRNGDRLHPLDAAQLASGVAEPIECHGLDQGGSVDRATVRAEGEFGALSIPSSCQSS